MSNRNLILTEEPLYKQNFGIFVLDSNPDRIYLGRRFDYDNKTDEWIIDHAFTLTFYKENGVSGAASDGPINCTLHGNGDIAIRIPMLQLATVLELSEKWRPFYTKHFTDLITQNANKQ